MVCIFKFHGCAMIIAIPLFGSEVSPRFGCAALFLIARVEEGRIVELKRIGMEESNSIQRIRKVADWKVNKLICGGIDGFCTRILNGMGIQVIPWAAGNAQEALEKHIAGLPASSHQKEAFFMKKPKLSPTAAVMVVGAGIGGIQTALDLANSGFLVHLVERSSGIGGVMPQLDKTFPTNECSL